ncbi:MAG: PAC2 family protein [Actinobacteria bacterium]|nr:PAC2 family protein [Actinomycetota bacterium]MBU1492998.1 PAC2 family protein [Actinomycetota bacterium]
MFEIHASPVMRAPVLVVAFDGWVSAGAVGTTAADHLAEDGDIVASFRPDRLYDFRVSRPVATFRDGMLQDIEWPSLTVRYRSIDGRDLLVLTGPEPNWNWPDLAAAVADLCAAFGVVEQISLGGIPWAAPHTRATEVVTTASRPDLLGPGSNAPEGDLQVPAALALVVEQRVSTSGIPAVGFWARVPHYIGNVYYPGVLELVERVARHTGIDIPLGSLVDDSAAQRRQLAALMESRPDARQMVERYEQLADAEDDAASGVDMTAEIERYLRDQIEGM